MELKVTASPIALHRTTASLDQVVAPQGLSSLPTLTNVTFRHCCAAGCEVPKGDSERQTGRWQKTSGPDLRDTEPSSQCLRDRQLDASVCRAAVASSQGKTAAAIMASRGMTMSAEAIARGTEVLAALDRPLTERRGRSLIAELASTKEELTAARDEIASTHAGLASTKEDLTAARDEIASTKEDLTAARDEIASTHAGLHSTKEELTTATERLAASEAAFAAYRADTAVLLAALTARLETVEGLTLGD